MNNWENVVSRFRNQALTKEEWTHAAHLVVALWHLLEYGDIEHALCFLRPGIILSNRSMGITNSDTRGYHETITVFWSRNSMTSFEGKIHGTSPPSQNAFFTKLHSLKRSIFFASIQGSS